MAREKHCSNNNDGSSDIFFFLFLVEFFRTPLALQTIFRQFESISRVWGVDCGLCGEVKHRYLSLIVLSYSFFMQRIEVFGILFEYVRRLCVRSQSAFVVGKNTCHVD